MTTLPDKSLQANKQGNQTSNQTVFFLENFPLRTDRTPAGRVENKTASMALHSAALMKVLKGCASQQTGSPAPL